MYKVELIYQFWHTTANAEKQLLQWLGEVNMEDKQGYVGTVLNPVIIVLYNLFVSFFNLLLDKYMKKKNLALYNFKNLDA